MTSTDTKFPSGRIFFFVLAAILILLPVSVFLNINMAELRMEEPRRAVIAVEMNLSGDYLVPRIYGVPYYNKPPLFNWVLSSFFKLTGSSDEWAARTPSLLCFILLGFVQYFFVRKYISPGAALLSSLFLLTSSDLYFFGTMISAEIDIFFMFLVFLQVILLWYFFNREQYLLMFIVSYLLAAAGFLTKGLPSVLFQGFTLLTVLIAFRKIKLLFHWKHVAGILVFLLITGGYFYLYRQQNPNVSGYLAKLYFDATEKSGLEGSGGSIFLNVVQFPLHLLRFLSPWILLLVLLAGKGARNQLPSNTFIRFALLFLAINCLPYLLTPATKGRYMYPLFPFACIILAYMYEALKNNQARVHGLLMKFFTGVLLVATVAVFSIPFFTGNIVSNAWLKSVILGIPLVIIFLLFIRTRTLHIYLLILFVILLRIGGNLFYYPYLVYKTPNIHRDYIQKITSITANEPVYLLGKPDTQIIKVSLGPWNFGEVPITNMTTDKYKIPYYYSMKTGKVMSYSPQIEKGKYYLAFSDTMPDTTTYQVLDVFKPAGYTTHIFLFHLNSSKNAETGNFR